MKTVSRTKTVPQHLNHYHLDYRMVLGIRQLSSAAGTTSSARPNIPLRRPTSRSRTILPVQPALTKGLGKVQFHDHKSMFEANKGSGIQKIVDKAGFRFVILNIAFQFL
jgi:hypothetical protein